MKKIIFVFSAIILISLGLNTQTSAQVYDPIKNCIIDHNGDCVPNTVLAAMPFLRITPDARSGGMGDVGIGLDPDPNAMHFNSSKLAFVDKNFAMSATYTPWLRDLGIDDVYLAYLSGFKQIDKLQTVGFGLRFFSLGEINFRDAEGNPSGTGNPREFELAGSFNRKLSEKFAMGLTAKYLYSNLASGQMVGDLLISSANSFAADLSMTYRTETTIGGYPSHITAGLAFTNVGSKVTYTQNDLKDFLPANVGIGTAVEMDFDDYNTMTFALDINKYMVPTPQARYCTDDNGDKIDCPDYYDIRTKSLFESITSSFSDAPGGAKEEFQELSYSVGIEYWYDKQFAVRAGYYFEHPLKGDRQFLTIGAGIKYNSFGINFSYLAPTSQTRNPLNNTLRFSLIFDFDTLTNPIEED